MRSESIYVIWAYFQHVVLGTCYFLLKFRLFVEEYPAHRNVGIEVNFHFLTDCVVENNFLLEEGNVKRNKKSKRINLCIRHVIKKFKVQN